MAPSTRFAVYSDRLKQLWTVAPYEGVQSQLKAGESDILTLVPIEETGDVQFAPIGLTNMLNSGGAISQWTNSSNAAEFKVNAESLFV